MADHRRTAGPFRVEVPPSSSGFGRAIYAEREDGPDIFVAYVGNWKQHPATENADAALFAAAPQMLAALKAVLPRLEALYDDRDKTAQWDSLRKEIEQVHAAIKQAESADV